MGRWLILMAAIALVPLSSHFSGVGLAGSFLARQRAGNRHP